MLSKNKDVKSRQINMMCIDELVQKEAKHYQKELDDDDGNGGGKVMEASALPPK